MKYNAFLFLLLSGRIAKGLQQFYPKKQIKRWVKAAKPIYKKLLTEVHGITDKNPMASNILTSFIIISIWLASERKITPDQMSVAMKTAMDMKILKKMYGSYDLNTQKGVDKIRQVMKKDADYAAAHPEETEAWDFNFDDSLHKDGFYYHFTRCPIANFCKEHGYEEINPVLCNIDYNTAELMHGVLYREQTVAGGGTMCDYWMVGDKVKDPQ